MKILVAVAAVAAVALAAGCASQEGVQYARNECKIVPITTLSVAGKPRPAGSLERRQAEMALGTSQYRQQQLAQHGRFGNNVEEALYDCP